MSKEIIDFVDSDTIYALADDLYFEIIKMLGIEKECVVESKHQEGTENTRLGRHLYYLIEDVLRKKLKVEDE